MLTLIENYIHVICSLFITIRMDGEQHTQQEIHNRQDFIHLLVHQDNVLV